MILCPFARLEGASNSCLEAATLLKNQLSEINMLQCHPLHPEKGYTLDLAFCSSRSLRFLHDLDLIVPPDSQHHLSSTFDLQEDQPLQPNFHISRYNFNKIDCDLLNNCLFSINWIQVFDFNILNINQAIYLFYDILYDLIDYVTPKYDTRIKNFPEWYSKELIDMISAKKAAYGMENVKGLSEIDRV